MGSEHDIFKKKIKFIVLLFGHPNVATSSVAYN